MVKVDGRGGREVIWASLVTHRGLAVSSTSEVAINLDVRSRLVFCVFAGRTIGEELSAHGLVASE